MPGQKPYHHGNLRSTLLDASLVLIREHGLDHFSLRQLAAHAGVSHTAAYRHFSSKEQILAALSQTVFKRISDRIHYHSLKGYAPEECLLLGVLAYLRYALDRPDEFRLLLSLGATASPTLLETLHPLIEACAFRSGSKDSTALLLLANIHGLAELALRRHPGLATRKQSVDLATQSLKILISGLKN